LREEPRLRLVENRVLKRIFGSKRDKVTGEWESLRNEELKDLYSSANTIRVIKSRMRLAGRVVHMGKGEEYTGLWWENLKESDNVEDSGADGRIILKQIFKKWDEAWNGLIWLTIPKGGGFL
jgi:hypothetical protein